ncbi:MAG: hypothetical protein WD674_00585 [Cucumibacter sp.]
MSDTLRPGRDEALLSKLDRTMDSILSSNAAIPFKPRLFPRYAVARLIAWLTTLVGWAIILIGLAALALKFGIGSLPAYADLVDGIKEIEAAGGILGGLMLINFAALTRAGLDAADYARQSLQLSVARSVMGLARARTPGKAGAPETDSRRSRTEPLAEIVEPRVP